MPDDPQRWGGEGAAAAWQASSVLYHRKATRKMQIMQRRVATTTMATGSDCQSFFFWEAPQPDLDSKHGSHYFTAKPTHALSLTLATSALSLSLSLWHMACRITRRFFIFLAAGRDRRQLPKNLRSSKMKPSMQNEATKMQMQEPQSQSHSRSRS